MRGQLFLLFAFVAMCFAASSCSDYPTSIITWSSQSSWNVAGASVVIAANQNVLLDVSPPKLANIQVHGHLYVANKNINVSVAYINVFPYASFIVGTANCPITSKVIFEFYGARQPDTQIDMGKDLGDGQKLGSKGVAIQTNATFIVYGAWQGPSWTNLAQIAYNGTKQLHLREKVYWKAGDEIIITSTDYSESIKSPFDSSVSWQSAGGYVEPDQTEKVSVLSVDSTGQIITITEPLKYTHWAGHYQYAEVALLTRNVVFAGDNSSIDSEFGMQLMMRKANQITIAGAEFTKGGQKGLIGRYPIHFHFAHDCTGMGYTVMHSSSHDNFQRSLTIHETSGVFVQDVVAYKTFGHMFFLEVGGEANNTFLHCLGATAYPVPDTLSAHGLSPIQIIPTDSQPSIFWITNPHNNFTDNVAVGGLFGFWISTPALVLTAAAQAFHPANYIPMYLRVIAFKNNTAHSASQNGFMVGNRPDANGVSTGGGYIATYSDPFLDNTFYKCRRACAWCFNNLVHSGTKFIDCPQGIFHQGSSSVTNSIFVGVSANNGTSSSMKNAALPVGFTTYDVGGPSHSINNTFVNFTKYTVNNKGIRSDSGGHSISGNGLGPNVYIINATYHNANAVSNYRIGNSIGNVVYLDSDGSSTGISGGGYFVSSGFANQTLGLPSTQCQWVAATLSYRCALTFEGFHQFALGDITEVHYNQAGNITLSQYSWDLLNGTSFRQVSAYRFNITNVLDQTKKVSVMSSGAGNIQACLPNDPAPCNTLLANMPNSQLLSVKFVYNSIYRATPKQIWIIGYHVAPGDWTIFSIPYPATAKLQVTDHNTGANLTAVSSYALLNDTSYFFDTQRELLWLMYRQSALQNSVFYNRPSTTWIANSQYQYTDGLTAAIRVTATCPGTRFCAPSEKNLKLTYAPPTSSPYPNIINNLNKYTGLLTTCQVTPATSATYGSGKVQITYSKEWNEVQVSLLHSLSNYAPVIVFGRQSASTGALTYFAPQNLPPTSPCRIGFRPSPAFLAAMYAGELFIQINTNPYPKGHIRAVVYCDGKCSAPSILQDASPCPHASPSVLYVFNGTASSLFRISTYNAKNWTIDTTNPYCGVPSFIANNPGGQVQFLSVGSFFTVTPSAYKYIELYAKVASGGPSSSLSPKVYLRTTSVFQSTMINLASYAINGVVDVDSGWQLISVPISAFGIGSSFNLTAIIFAGTDTSYFINGLRFSAKASATSLINSSSVASRPSSYGTCKTANPYLGAQKFDGSSSSPVIGTGDVSGSSSSPEDSSSNNNNNIPEGESSASQSSPSPSPSPSAPPAATITTGGENESGENQDAQKSGSAQQAGKKGSSMPIIIGCVVGGVALVAAVAGAVVIHRRRASQRGSISANPLYAH